jgi:2-succinyl-5-enolpyruvyl-6-hydroxy-3-cyclohexene-1-carboxylate synthase
MWTRATAGVAAVPAELAGVLTSIPLNGVVVAGDGLTSADADAAVRLAELAGWPLIAEPHSGARRGAQALRGADALLTSAAFTSRHRPDLVVVCGRVGLSRAVLRWLAGAPHVVVDRGPWRDVTRSARTVYTVGAETLAAIDPTPVDDDWSAGWRQAAARASTAVDAELDADDRLTEPRIARDLAAAVPDEGALVVASSMPIRDLDLTMAPRALAVLANRGVSGIDGFASTVQGIALSGRFRGPVVGLAGDLSLLHDVNGLLPADPRPDATIVVVNNDGGGIFSLLEQGRELPPAPFEQLFGTPHGVDFAALAAAYRIHHRRATTVEELVAAAAPGEGLRLVEVRTERAANAALHARLREVAAAAVDAES